MAEKTPQQIEKRFRLVSELGRLAREYPDDADALSRFVFDLTKDSPCPDPTCLFCESKDADDFIRRLNMLDPRRGGRG